MFTYVLHSKIHRFFLYNLVSCKEAEKKKNKYIFTKFAILTYLLFLVLIFFLWIRAITCSLLCVVIVIIYYMPVYNSTSNTIICVLIYGIMF